MKYLMKTSCKRIVSAILMITMVFSLVLFNTEETQAWFWEDMEVSIETNNQITVGTLGYQLEADSNKNSTKITFDSYSDAYVSIDNTGYITFKSAGVTDVTVKISGTYRKNGKTYTDQAEKTIEITTYNYDVNIFNNGTARDINHIDVRKKGSLEVNTYLDGTLNSTQNYTTTISDISASIIHVDGTIDNVNYFNPHFSPYEQRGYVYWYSGFFHDHYTYDLTNYFKSFEDTLILSFTETYNDGGTIVSTNKMVSYTGETLVALALACSGYSTFWGVSGVDATIATSENVNQYTVTFDEGNGNAVISNVYQEGETVAIPEDPSKAADLTYTYLFENWNPVVATTCDGSASYTAAYKATYIDYTITFYDEDGMTVLATDTVHYGDAIVTPEDPSKAADKYNTYVFAGWDTEVAQTCEGNASYTATYEATPIEYTVTFYDEDMETVISTDASLLYKEKIVIPADPIKAADAMNTYTFAGWVNAKGNAVTINKVKKNINYYASYTATPIEYTVTFYDEDMETVIASDEAVLYGDTIVLPTEPIKAADAMNTYVFAGWVDEEGNPVEIGTCEANVDYYASYTATPIEYTVTFYDEDMETVIALDEAVLYGDEIVLPTEPSKAADASNTYVFAGWVDEEGNPVEIGTCEGNADYYASYTETSIEYTVTFFDEDMETVIALDEAVLYGDVIVLPTEPIKAADEINAYAFAGWVDEEGNPVEIGTCEGNADYYASYTATPIEYTVTFFDEDGETVILLDEAVLYGDVIVLPTEPTKAADEINTYVFAGWVDEEGNPVEIGTCEASVDYYASYTATAIPVETEEATTAGEVEADTDVVEEPTTEEATEKAGEVEADTEEVTEKAGEVEADTDINTSDKTSVFELALLVGLGMAAVVGGSLVFRKKEDKEA